MNTPEQARGEHYFRSADCPIAVRRLRPSASLQHHYDLTLVPHSHDFSELVLVVGGRGEQSVNGEILPVLPGDVFFLHGGAEHFFTAWNELDLCNVLFDPARLPLPETLLRKISGYRLLFKGTAERRLRLGAPELLRAEEKVRRLSRELERPDPSGEAGAFAALLELILFLSTFSSVSAEDRSTALARLGALPGKLERSCQEAWTLAEMARLAGISANHFLRVFRAATGTTPFAHLNLLRLKRAAVLLEAGKLRVGEVAERCGYSDSNYFSRQFRRHYGVSPRAYRDAATR